MYQLKSTFDGTGAASRGGDWGHSLLQAFKNV